ncbi:hypothetical protein [Achromobacter xylosoxidans]|uniref:hypothetical protein n=1 Tax=Alcaligenes xylosoxydans xylosoxydans TaxID=85698 RepID=UPI001F143364|nr:hypothetical protein [Achromobacter xylosoxidans]
MVITIEQHELQRLLVEAARQGANHAIEGLVCYHYNEACERLGVSYNTLKKRIQEGKIRSVDGRITGGEIRRYLGNRPGGATAP